MSRSDPQFNLRMPIELKTYLEEEARKNKRSLTAEILDRLEAGIIMDKKIHDARKDEDSSVSTIDRIVSMSNVLVDLASSLKNNKR